MLIQQHMLMLLRPCPRSLQMYILMDSVVLSNNVPQSLQHRGHVLHSVVVAKTDPDRHLAFLKQGQFGEVDRIKMSSTASYAPVHKELRKLRSTYACHRQAEG